MRIEENTNYSDSIEVLLEKRPDGDVIYMYNLTVCSLSAVLVTAIATSYSNYVADGKVEYRGHVLREDGTTAPPQRFLFDHNWLDRADNCDGTPRPITHIIPAPWAVYPNNSTYPARPGVLPRVNGFVNLGVSLSLAPVYPTPNELETETFPIEATVRGILTYLLSHWLPPD